MSSIINTSNNNCAVSMARLKSDDLDNYLKIQFDAFLEKIMPVFGNNKEAALNIIRSEILRNINNRGRYVARLENKTVGIVEIITRENIKSYVRDFRSYIKYLGFLKGLWAFIITAIEIPRLNSGTIYIDTVAVESNHRRKGVAEKMLLFIEDLARKNGKSALTLWVAAKNSKAFSLYKKSGFSAVIKRSSSIMEKYTGYRDWIYMKKEIT